MMYVKYLQYLIRHKWYVLVECCRFGLLWRGILHDMSKFRPDEFMPYARYFYGDYPSEKDLIMLITTMGMKHSKESVQRDFDRAWLRHQHRNPHHWQYWVLREDDGGTKVIEMDDVYYREMLADWRGAGRALGKESWNDTLGWYLSHRHTMLFHPSTSRMVNASMYQLGKIQRKTYAQ